MADVVILGAGVMGAAMTFPAAHHGAQVTLVGTPLDGEIVRSVGAKGLHPGLGIKLPPSVTAFPWTDFGATLAKPPRLLVLGVSSAGVGWALDRMVESLPTPLPVVIITKGLACDNGAIEIIPRLIARELKRRAGLAVPVYAIGGPCIAAELAAGRDTSVVVAGRDPELLGSLLKYLHAPFYHPCPSADLAGVEVCAAFKNFYAVAVGAVSGMLERDGKAANGAVMHNLAAAVFSQALTEMMILVEAFGGDSRTVSGLAGAGDLYVTCQAGRNGRLGRLLGLGYPYSVAKNTHMPADTVEGAQLAIDVGPVLDGMMRQELLPAARLPLASAIIAAICTDVPLRLSFDAFTRP